MCDEQALFKEVESDNYYEEKEQDLRNACERGDLDEVKRLVDSGVSVNCRDKYGRTPLHFAESRKMRDFLRDLDNDGYSVWVKEQDLMKACKRGNLDEVKLLVDSGVSVNCRDKESEQELIDVCKRGDIQEARRLISTGVSVNCRDKNGWTPIYHAARENHNEVAELLISSGACLNEKDEHGHTALIIAVCNNYQECARLLIESGANINIQNNNGDTALLMAITYSRQELFLLLIDRGARVDIQNIHGETVFKIACLLFDEEICRVLIDTGSVINQKEIVISINHARKCGCNQMVDLLTKHLRWLSRRDFLMFLATQSYLTAVPFHLADSMSRDELRAHYNTETRPNTALHAVFFMQELQRYIMSFLGSN